MHARVPVIVYVESVLVFADVFQSVVLITRAPLVFVCAQREQQAAQCLLVVHKRTPAVAMP